jgi:MFS family permease
MKHSTPHILLYSCTDSDSQYFTHQRGTYMALYAFMLAGSNYFAPVICGFINDYQGWRWVFYWPAIFLAFTFIFLFFFMEETNYDRKTVGVIESLETSPAGSISATDEEKSEDCSWSF